MTVKDGIIFKLICFGHIHLYWAPGGKEFTYMRVGEQ